MHEAGAQHRGIEREQSTEPSVDVEQDLPVLHERVRVVGGHHAAPAQGVQVDRDRPDHHAEALPLALGQTIDPGNDDVRSESTAIASERGDRAIGRDQERQDVESCALVTCDQAKVAADFLPRLAHRRADRATESRRRACHRRFRWSPANPSSRGWVRAVTTPRSFSTCTSRSPTMPSTRDLDCRQSSRRPST